MSLQAPLWRSIAVFRAASLVYATVLLAIRPQYYQHWGWAWVVLAAMTVWTALSTVAYTRPARRTWALLVTDLVITVLALMSTALVQDPRWTTIGVMPVTATWLAGPALTWAIAKGVSAGVVAAAVIGCCVVSLRWPIAGTYSSTALDGPVILLLAAALVGYVSTLSGRAERALQRATEIEASSRERERLARTIHDSVLQMLAMVQRRGAEAGGEAAEIGRLAGEQEAALRALVTGDEHASAGSGGLDLSARLGREASALVSVITPADPVILNERAVIETAAAVSAAIDNVRRHCGATARVWVLVDDEGAAVTVMVRDDGPGIPAGRLAEAAAEGRLGVSQSISGRIRDLGGSADISSTPGAGTEVRLRLPRAALPA